MSKVAKMVRDVIGPGGRETGDVDVPHVLTVHVPNTKENKEELIQKLCKAFPTWRLTVLLEKEIGLDNIQIFWSEVRDTDGKLIGAVRCQENTGMQVEFVDFPFDQSTQSFLEFIRGFHAFHTSVMKTFH